MSDEQRIDILLVDDLPENLLALEQVLEQPDLNLVKAESGEEALARLLERDFALVLLDVQMPGMDGFEVAELMRGRKKTRDIPIVFITAISKEDRFVHQGYAVGAVDYLFKPFDPDILRGKVKVFCDLFRQRRAVETEVAKRRQAEASLQDSEQRYRLLVELSPLAMLIHAGDAIVYANRACLNLLGEPDRDAMIGKRTLDYVHEDSVEIAEATLESVLKMGDRVDLLPLRMVRGDGALLDVEVGMAPVLREGEIAVQAFVRDITEQRRAAVALAASEERYRIVTELTSDFVYWRAPDGNLRYVSPSAEEFTGYTPDAFVENPALLDEIVHPEDRGLWESTGRDITNNNEAGTVEFRICTRNEGIRWVSHISRPVHSAGSGAFIGVRASQRDVTRRREMEDQLRRLTYCDGLTGIANRRHFDEELNKEWRRHTRTGAELSVVMMDVDFFKKYNDNYGHQEGDACLKQVAKTLSQCVRRPRDLVARYGGEEFVVILPETGIEGAFKIAETMRASIEELGITHAYRPSGSVLTISLGVACMVPSRDVSEDALVQAADAALYRAKRNGRNRAAGPEAETPGRAAQ